VDNTSGPQNTIRVGTARIALERVELAPDVLLDEVTLDGGDLRFTPPDPGQEPTVRSGETRVRGIMSEANLNRLIAAKLPADAPVRGLSVVLLSGRARISGKALVTIVPFPFSVEAKPVIENGVRVVLDFSAATLGVDMPRAVVELLQARINESLYLDVSALEIPIWIDEIRCEPGRLTAFGRARIEWPVQQAAAALPPREQTALSSGFTASSTPLFGDSEPSRRALASGPAAPSDASARQA